MLLKAVQADTEFLSCNNVMDYSMLTGIDENNKVLVLGIIGQLKVIIIVESVMSSPIAFALLMLQGS